ncbi:MAG: class I SAM-dependent methyltransferase [Clostridiales bacterium]|nr:class I SAM-dependent methyltransferase [Clostridiales bacterium]
MIYKSLAHLYDVFMEDVPYEDWLKNIEHYLEKYNIKPKTVLDLGCGTGQMSILFAKKGCEVTGADISEEMLTEAYNNAVKAGVNPLFVQQDMREFSSPEGYDLIISLCDCLNYITDKDDLKKVFENCKNTLNDNGLFIFDLNTPYKLKEILGNGSFCQTTDSYAFTCENCFDEDKNICEYYVNIFSENPDGSYERAEECHYERAYSVEEIKGLLKETGFKLLETADADGLEAPTETTERIYFTVRKDNEI